MENSSDKNTAFQFINTLNEGGYLITSHGELCFIQKPGSLKPKVFPAAAVIYQKVCDSGRHVAEKATISFQPPAIGNQTGVNSMTLTNASSIINEKSSLPDKKQEMERPLRRDDYAAVIEKARLAIGNEPQNFDAYYGMAWTYANAGDYAQAIICCKKAIESDETAGTPYFLLAYIAEMQDNGQEAKDLLKKALYLDSTCIAAYVELGAIYDKEGDTARAARMRNTAMELLKTLSPQSVVEPYKEITAGELLHYIKKMVDSPVRF